MTRRHKDKKLEGTKEALRLHRPKVINIHGGQSSQGGKHKNMREDKLRQQELQDRRKNNQVGALYLYKGGAIHQTTQSNSQCWNKLLGIGKEDWANLLEVHCCLFYD